MLSQLFWLLLPSEVSSLFHFDSDEDVFCVYSQYIDDLMLLSKMIRAACDNEKTMGMYLNMSEVAKA